MRFDKPSLGFMRELASHRLDDDRKTQFRGCQNAFLLSADHRFVHNGNAVGFQYRFGFNFGQSLSSGLARAVAFILKAHRQTDFL